MLVYPIGSTEVNVLKAVPYAQEKFFAWQTRSLDALYPIVYLDGIVVKIRHFLRTDLPLHRLFIDTPTYLLI